MRMANCDFINDDEPLLRRAPNRPEYIAIDVLTGEARMTMAALKFDPDGISVYRQQVLQTLGLDPADIRTKPDQYVFAFTAEAVREVPGWDVAFTPESCPEVERAHSSVVHELARPPKPAKEALRIALIAVARPLVRPDASAA
jgi:hypothetical protein